MPQDRIAGHMTHWRVWDRGGERPVLALHCMLAHSGIWAGMAQHLQGVTLTAPDAPGHGQSGDWGGQGNYHRLATNTAIEITLSLGAGQPVDLIGHSFGGTVALRLALERPELVRSLTLIEPAFFAAAKGTAAYTKVCAMNDEMEVVLQESPSSAAAMFHQFWGVGEKLEEMPALLRAYIVERVALVPLTNDILLEDAAGMLKPGRLEGLRCPVLLLQGSDSPVIVAAIQDELAARLPHPTRLVVKGARHMVPLTHAGEVARAIQAHLDSA